VEVLKDARDAVHDDAVTSGSLHTESAGGRDKTHASVHQDKSPSSFKPHRHESALNRPRVRSEYSG